VKCLGQAAEGNVASSQGTPDLRPADLIGTPVYRPGEGEFEFVPGPVFHNLVLVDEINRAPPKVQSALLEAMAEHQVTVGNDTHALPDPFLVVATQNPIEHEGTFPLPEAQLDRFLLHVVLQLPDAETERAILNLVEAEGQTPPDTPSAISLSDLAQARAAVAGVHLAPELRDYIVRIVMATREGDLCGDIEHPVSPRGTLALAASARARAHLHGRNYALPEDVDALAGDALAHRMVLSWRAIAEGRRPRDVIADIVKAVEPL